MALELPSNPSLGPAPAAAGLFLAIPLPRSGPCGLISLPQLGTMPLAHKEDGQRPRLGMGAVPCQSLFKVFNGSSNNALRIKSHVCVHRPCITWPLHTSADSFSSMCPSFMMLQPCLSLLVFPAPQVLSLSPLCLFPRLSTPLLPRLLPPPPAHLDLSSNSTSPEALLDPPILTRLHIALWLLCHITLLISFTILSNISLLPVPL